jgi:ATP-dependent DNA helicase RecG
LSILSDIRKGESRKIEFKEYLPESSKISKTIISFSNGAGGKLIIGVNDKGEITGVSEDEVLEIPDKISNIVYDSCYPAIIPEIYIENIKGKNVIIVEVFPGNLKPYYLKSKGKLKGTYIRVGATNKLSDEEMIMELERQRRNISFDEECVYDYDLAKINLSKLNNDFYRFTKKELNEENLINLKLIKEEHGIKYATRALILLTDSNLFSYARIKCARFKGKDTYEFIDQKELTGPIYEQVEEAIKFAKAHINKHGKITELQRIDEYEIPIVAIREIIANAVVHRDYSISGADIKFAIFDDRIEITSPGLLPKTLDIEDIKIGRSEIKNKVIARFFKEIKFIEEWGTGIKRIIKSCTLAGLEEPQFIETGMFFKVIIKKNNNDKVAISVDKVAISGDKIRESHERFSIDSTRIQLSDAESKIILYLKEYEVITNRKAREITGMSSSGVRKVFEGLVQKNLIIAYGDKKSRYYKL